MWRWIRIQNFRNRWCHRRLNWRKRNLSRLLIIISQSQRRLSHHQKIIKRIQRLTHQRPHLQKKRKICFRYLRRCLQHHQTSYWWSSWISWFISFRRSLFHLNHQTRQQNGRQCRLIKNGHPHDPSHRRIILIILWRNLSRLSFNRQT